MEIYKKLKRKLYSNCLKGVKETANIIILNNIRENRNTYYFIIMYQLKSYMIPIYLYDLFKN